MNIHNSSPIIDNSGFILHGGDYNPDQWLDRPDIIEADFRLMKQAGLNTFTLGVFAWTSYEPEEGQYDFRWLDEIMDRMAAEGHKVILATPSGSKPAWLSASYPEIRRVNKEGLREPHVHRHNHCWSSPVYREKVIQINTKLAERYKNHPALGMWHISNEFGGSCFCDRCLSAFRRWLEQKYGTLGTVNKNWWTAFWNHTYTDWDQIDPRDDSIDALQTDWSRFLTDQIIDFYQAERETLEQLCPHIPKTTNLMGRYGQINYWELAKHLDVIADDSYPGLDRHKADLWKDVAALSMTHDLMRMAAKRTGRPWMLMESAPSFVQWKPTKLKAPGLHKAEMLNAVAHGAEGILYFQWRRGCGGSEKLHAGVVDHEGSEHPRLFREVAETSQLLKASTPVMGSTVTAEAAIIYDWESRWQLRDSWGTRSHWCIQGNDAGYDPESHYRELWRRSIPADVLSTEHDFSMYKIIIAPQLFMLKPGVARKIEDYVLSGGVFVATYYTGYVNETGNCFEGGWPGDGLRSFFGVWNEEYDLILPDEKKRIRFADGTECQVSRINEILHAENADILAEHAGDFYEGSPAVTCRRYGKGAAVYVGTEPDAEGYQKLYDVLLEMAGVGRHGICIAKPDCVSVRSRRNPHTQEEFVFITNWSGEALRISLGDSPILPFGSQTPCCGTVELRPFECLCGKRL